MGEQADKHAGGSLTVVVAFAVNLLVAVAKTVAAAITGSASLVAEAAHSWADTGNEVFLIIAERRSRKPADARHPMGYGRAAYVWSMFAALGLFTAGSVVSITHGVQELVDPEPAQSFLVGYVVLAISFVLEAVSFAQSVRQIRLEAQIYGRDFLEHVVKTSDPTLRAVFAEDSSALIGLVIAGVGMAIHQITGSPTPDSTGSILVGILLGVVAVKLLSRNVRFLVGEHADGQLWSAALRSLLALPEVERVTYLRLEILGPRMLDLIAEVDLTGNDRESTVARTIREVERQMVAANPSVVYAHIGLSVSDEPSLVPDSA